jgi:phytanoyl-CoA dioxygenase PhyH
MTEQGLRDATALAPDRAALLARLDADSYLFFPGLLPTDVVSHLRGEITDILGSRGWLADGRDALEAVAGGGARREDHKDPAWMETYGAIQRLQHFHELAHHAALCDLLGRILGTPLLVHPRKVVRLMPPEAIGRATPAHQDFRVIQGTSDVITAWMPLGDCPHELGGLRVLRGSTRTGLLPVTQAQGPLGQELQVSEDDERWLTAELRAGDVLLFHSMTVHGGLPNLSERIRISVDFRYQLATDPITVGSLLPYYFPLLPGWEELAEGWSSRAGISTPQLDHFPAPTFDPRGSSLPAPTSRLVTLQVPASATPRTEVPAQP